MSASVEPAIRSYFFGKGYRDLKATIVECWGLNRETASEYGAKASLEWSHDRQFHAVLWWAAAISVVVFGTITFVLASTVHVVLLGLLFLLVYLGFTLVYLLERLYLAYRGFSAVCPSCHAKAGLPEYFCSGCGRIHSNLVPSSYGILKRTCLCGQRLPTTFFLKRGELQARCRECEHLLHRDHTETRKIFLPIVGGPVAGKSAFLYAAIRELIDRVFPGAGLTPTFLDDASRHGYERVAEGFEQGRPPDKTGSKLPTAFNLKLDGAPGGPRLLYVYDPAGEAFLDSEEMVLHRYQSYLSGLVFLIDPFSIPRVRVEYHDLLEEKGEPLQPSRMPVEDALARLLLSLEENFGLAKTERIDAPVAVVLSKADAFDLEGELGLAAGQADSDGIRAVLMGRWDQADLVHRLESRFAEVRFFLSSALGHMPGPDAEAFEPRGVTEPVLWLLRQGDRKLLGGSTTDL